MSVVNGIELPEGMRANSMMLRPFRAEIHGVNSALFIMMLSHRSTYVNNPYF
jgi:hypothetical protein